MGVSRMSVLTAKKLPGWHPYSIPSIELPDLDVILVFLLLTLNTVSHFFLEFLLLTWNKKMFAEFGMKSNKTNVQSSYFESQAN